MVNVFSLSSSNNITKLYCMNLPMPHRTKNVIKLWHIISLKKLWHIMTWILPGTLMCFRIFWRPNKAHVGTNGLSPFNFGAQPSSWWAIPKSFWTGTKKSFIFMPEKESRNSVFQVLKQKVRRRNKIQNPLLVEPVFLLWAWYSKLTFSLFFSFKPTAFQYSSYLLCD